MKKDNNTILLDRLLSAVISLSLQGEIWKEILSRDIADETKTCVVREALQGKYFISNYGRVLSLCRKEPHIKQQQLHNGRYLRTIIDGKPMRINRLLAEYFIGDIRGKEVHHINTNSQDNTLDNLEIQTRAEHIQKHKELREKENECGELENNSD